MTFFTKFMNIFVGPLSAPHSTFVVCSRQVPYESSVSECCAAAHCPDLLIPPARGRLDYPQYTAVGEVVARERRTTRFTRTTEHT
jgi:hypothetical protein